MYLYIKKRRNYLHKTRRRFFENPDQVRTMSITKTTKKYIIYRRSDLKALHHNRSLNFT